MFCWEVSTGIDALAKSVAGSSTCDLTASVGGARIRDISGLANVVFSETLGGILTFNGTVLGKLEDNGFVRVEEDFPASFRFSFRILLSRTEVAISSVGVASGLRVENITLKNRKIDHTSRLKIKYVLVCLERPLK